MLRGQESLVFEATTQIVSASAFTNQVGLIPPTPIRRDMNA
jgi:hypothetical protein